MRSIALAALWAFALCLACSRVHATEHHLQAGQNITAAMPAAQPGDTVILHQGTYPSAYIQDLHGTADAWITLKSADSEARSKLAHSRSDQHVINLRNCSFVKLENLEITGGADGVRFVSDVPSHDIVLEGLYIHNVGGSGINALSTAELYNVTIRHCEIAFTGGNGEGVYLGKRLGQEGKQVHDCLIEGNYIHDTGGNRGDGIAMNHGDYRNIVQDNVISVCNGYPGITAWGTYQNDPAQNNIIRRNLVIGTSSAGIFVTSEVSIENNIVANSLNHGILCRGRDGDSKIEPT